MQKSIWIILGGVFIALAIIAFSSGCFGLCVSSNRVIIKTLSPSEFVSLWNQTKDTATLIDVRTPEEYMSGHYKNAQNLNFYDELNFKNALNKMDKNKRYLIYCRSGHRSGLTLKLMKKLGFKEVYDLSGGISRAGDIIPIVK